MLKKTVGLLLLVSSTAFASDATLGFNNLSARYISSDADAGSGDGYGLDLSFSLTKNIFVSFDYNTRSLDSVDVEYFSGGLGGNFPLNEAKTVQLFGLVSWEQLDLSADGSSSEPPTTPEEGGGDGCDFTKTPIDQLFSLVGGLLGGCDLPFSPQSKALTTGGNGRTDGYGATIGIRALVMDNVEVNGGYTYRDYENFEETIYSVGAAYTFGNWVATLSYDTFDEFALDEWSLGIGYTFGKSEEGESSIW